MVFGAFLGSLWPPFGPSCDHSGCLRPSKTLKKSPTPTEVKTHQEIAVNTPRIHQEPPRIRRDPLRTFQGPAVRTPSTNISHNATAKKRLSSATCREPPRTSREPPRTSREPAVRTLDKNTSPTAKAKKVLHSPSDHRREGLE